LKRNTAEGLLISFNIKWIQWGISWSLSICYVYYFSL